MSILTNMLQGICAYHIKKEKKKPTYPTCKISERYPKHRFYSIRPYQYYSYDAPGVKTGLKPGGHKDAKLQNSSSLKLKGLEL